MSETIMSKALGILCNRCKIMSADCAHYPCELYMEMEQLLSAQPEMCVNAVEMEEGEQNERAIGAIGLKQALAVSAILKDKKTIEQIIDEQPTIEPDWNEMLVICDCCGHAIHVKREKVKSDECGKH